MPSAREYKDDDYYPPVNRVTIYPKAPVAVRPEPSLAATGQTIRSTNQHIHSYTNAHNQHLQEQIPPNKPYIGLRRAYRPGYAICVIIGGVINVVSGIIMTALAYSSRSDLDNEAVRVLKVLGPVVIAIGIIFLVCGLVLLLHFRKTQREEKQLRERGHGYYDRPSQHSRRPRHREETRPARDGPVYSTDAASVPATQGDYSLYDEIPRNARRHHNRRPRPLPSAVVEPVGGDWKYVSHVKDMTLTPSRYPREFRKSERRAGDPYRMYPYDSTFKKESYSEPAQTTTSQPRPQQNDPAGKPPRIRSRDRNQELQQRY